MEQKAQCECNPIMLKTKLVVLSTSVDPQANNLFADCATPYNAPYSF